MTTSELESHLETIIAHYDDRNDHVSYHECLNELDRIREVLASAYQKLLSRQQENKPQSTPVGVGSGRAIGKKIQTGRDVGGRQ